MPEVPILIVCIVLLTLSLGLPLLLKPDSRIPDYLGFGLLGAALLYFAWSMDAWWMLLAAVAIAAFVAWLDRKGPEPAARHYDARCWSDRTRLRLRLWVAANLVGQALIVGIVVVVATGAPLLSFGLLVECLLLSVLASNIFRFSFNNAAERDQRAHTGANDANQGGPASEASAPASPAPFG